MARRGVCRGGLRCAAVGCGVPRWVAMCRGGLRCAAMGCDVPRWVAMCRSLYLVSLAQGVSGAPLSEAVVETVVGRRCKVRPVVNCRAHYGLSRRVVRDCKRRKRTVKVRVTRK